MTIIVQGRADWPLHVDHVCGWCGTVYRLEPHGRWQRSLTVWSAVESPCPECGRWVRTDPPLDARRVAASDNVASTQEVE